MIPMWNANEVEKSELAVVHGGVDTLDMSQGIGGLTDMVTVLDVKTSRTEAGGVDCQEEDDVQPLQGRRRASKLAHGFRRCHSAGRTRSEHPMNALPASWKSPASSSLNAATEQQQTDFLHSASGTHPAAVHRAEQCLDHSFFNLLFCLPESQAPQPHNK